MTAVNFLHCKSPDEVYVAVSMISQTSFLLSSTLSALTYVIYNAVDLATSYLRPFQ